MNRYIILFALFVLLFCCGRSGTVMAQTCSVNAGVPSSLCVTADSFMLAGNATGLLSTTATWSLVSGPNIPVISSPASPNTSVKGFIAGTYIFSYSATCSDATVVADSVTVTVTALPVFTAGSDTFVCGSLIALNASLPAGATGLWSAIYPPAPNGISSVLINSPTSRTSNMSLGTYNTTCPKSANMIWTVTQGACTARDTVLISLGGQNTAFPKVADANICATLFNAATYYYGCGGNIVTSQLSGPGAATIGYSSMTGSNSYTTLTVSNMIKGTYTFAVAIGTCSGTTFRDTFNVTVGTTVPLSNSGITSKLLCPEQFDSVYFFAPTATLLPGETLRWNSLTPYSKSPFSLPDPVADTTGGILTLRNVLHPDTNTTINGYNYSYSYTISNGTCSQLIIINLTLYTPLANKPFVPVINLPCGVTSANITQPLTGTTTVYNFRNLVVLSKPAGAPNPGSTSTGNSITVTGLQPGKYLFSFEYYIGNASCNIKSAIVEINAGGIGGLANAGTNQILACGVDTTVLAGNTPPLGQVGSWQLISGPSTVVLTNPHSPSLLIKNLLPGYYTFRWSISSGTTCPGTSDEMIVVVTPNPPIANAGIDRNVCYGYSVPLNGNLTGLGITGRWRQIVGPAVTIVDTTSPNTSISGTVTGIAYTFTWTLSNVCGTDTDTVVITTGTSQGPSNAVITTADTCLTTSGTLTLRAIAPSSGSGLWSQLSGPVTAAIATPGSNSTNISGLSGGEYKFIWMVGIPGCDTLRDTVSVAYRTSALAANAGADRYICGDTVNLNAVTPTLGFGTWTQTGGPLSTINDLNTANTSVSGLNGGNTYDYRWTVSLGACPASSDEVHVGISELPSAAIAMADTVICGVALARGLTINFPITANAVATGIGAWSILEAPASASSTITNIAAPNTMIALMGGSTILQWQVTNGTCPATKDTVVIEFIPKADAGPANYSLCARNTQDLIGTEPAGGTVLWTQTSGPTAATITQPLRPSTQVINMAAGTYKFRYEVTHPKAGCSSFDSVTITNSARPVASAGSDTSFCWKAGSTILYLKADTPSLGTGIWSRNLGTGTVSYAPNANANPANANVTTAGLHQFRWTVVNGACQALDYKDVLVEQLSVPPIVFTPATACNDSFSVAVISPYSNFNYAWAFQRARIRDTAGINLTGPFMNAFLISDTNEIYLTMINPATGCTAKDSSAIIVNCAYLPLPLQLLSFEAKANGTTVNLAWTTANEKDIKLFHLERSADGTQWTRLADITARGNAQQYTFSDQQPMKGMNLYRLRIEELYGAYTYSAVRMVRMGETQGQSLLIYPNPAHQQLTVILESQTADNHYELMNAIGQVLLSGELLADNNTNSIDVSGLASGVYILKVTASDTVNSRQVQVIR